MTIGIAAVFAAALGLSFAPSASGQAQHLQEKVDIRPRPVPSPPPGTIILRRCLRHIGDLAKDCVESNTKIADHCVRIIRHLVANGHHRLAARIAKKCKHVIAVQTRLCVVRIHEVCERCANAIHNAGGSDHLLRLLKRGCRRAVGAVRKSREESCKRIIEALGLRVDAAG
jgi:hypothetical protein